MKGLKFDTVLVEQVPMKEGGALKPNLMTIDVEDWFHILGTSQGAPDPSQWDALPARVVDNTRRLMDILEEANAGATFFTLGWIARKHPALVREIAERGFDLGCHGDVHTMVHTQGPESFRQDVQEARRSLEDASGTSIKGYRAAGFSITAETPWAFEILQEEGFQFDASVFPGTHAHGGLTVPYRRPFMIETASGKTLYEFPVAATQIGGKMFPFGGGGYFRLLPEPLTSLMVKQMNRSQIPATLYLHPREIDPEQPRMEGLPLVRKLKYYINLNQTEEKLKALLKRSRFESIAQYLESSENRVSAASRLFSLRN